MPITKTPHSDTQTGRRLLSWLRRNPGQHTVSRIAYATTHTASVVACVLVDMLREGTVETGTPQGRFNEIPTYSHNAAHHTRPALTPDKPAGAR